MRQWQGRLVPPAAGVLLAAPVLAAPWPPSSDLSLHEGMVGLLARWGDPTFVPPGLYRLALGHGNQLFYFLAWPLARAVGPSLACRLLLALIVAGTIVAAGHLAAHLGRTRIAALAIAPAALGWAFYWGFVPQMLGFALWLALLPRLDRDAARGDARALASSSSSIALLGFAHIASMLCASLASAVFVLTRPVDRRTPLRLIPAAVGVVLAVLEDRWDRRVSTPLAQLFASRVLWHSPGQKLGELVAHLVGAHGTLTEVTVGLLVLVAGALWLTTTRPDRAASTPAGRRQWLQHHRFAVLASLLFGLYLAAPYSVNFGAFLYVRFLAPAFALAVILAAPPAGARGPLVIAPALALLAAPVVAALPQLSAATEQTRALDPLLALIEPGRSVAVLHFGKFDHGLLFEPTAFGNRVLGERGGRQLASFTEYPIAPVVVAPELRWDSIVLRVSAKSGSLRPATDLTRIEWVLVHVHDAALAPRVVRAFQPEAALVDASGEWQLFRSRLPQRPLTSPDGPGDEHAETLQDRVTRALTGDGNVRP
jgi:hypothetical protein